MAVAGIGQALAVALVVRSTACLVIPLAGVAVWQVVLRPPEEQYLLAMFGTEYREYRDQVRCWIPWRRFDAADVRSITAGRAAGVARPS